MTTKAKKPKATPRDHALVTAETGRKIAACVWDAIAAEQPDDADILAVYAERLSRCNSTGNIWHATDLHNADGEAFDGNGRFWSCGSKLCSYCLRKQSQRSRRNIRAAIEAQTVNPNDPTSKKGLPCGENYNFLTFTMPNLGIELLDAREIMNDAWQLFRKREWFRKTIIGGGKSEEFTQTKRGIHYHAHALVRSKYINYSTLRHTWTECLASAFRSNGRVLAAATSDQMAIANSRRVGSITDAIQEVAKYLTKCTSWSQVSTDQLLNLCRIERWPRMFELFGSFRLPQPVAVPEDDEEIDNKLDYLDTKALSDGDPETGWREFVKTHGVANYLDKLSDEQNKQAEIRMLQLKAHYKAAKFRRIREEYRMDIEGIVKRIYAIYDRSGKPPPKTLRVGSNLQTRLDLNYKYGTSIEAVNRGR